MKILIATTNHGKKKGLLEGLHPLANIEFISLKDFSPIQDIEETGKTFKENARQKAEYYAKKCNIPTLGEDSGILVDAFPHKFGIKTRREFGENISDIEWLEKFLAMMNTQENRKATFVSTIYYYNPTTKENHSVEGSISGTITEFPQTPVEKGIPASSIFIPDGADVVLGALNKKEKIKYSHRHKACHKIKSFLESL